MALTMVHLLAAYAWAQDKPELLDCPEYYLGAVSPDAIHVRDGNDKSRKNETHLNNWNVPHPENIVNYWEDHFTPFDIGYGIHCLTDCQWVQHFHTCLRGMFFPDGKLNALVYYNDTFINDFELHYERPETPFLMDMLRRAMPPENHPQLRGRELGKWRDMIFELYENPCPKNDPVQYVTHEYVEGFLKQCSALFTETYERVKDMNPTQRSILDRRSNRGFSPAKLSHAQLEDLLDAALASPTACNYQDWHFSFVQDAPMLDAFSAEYCEMMLAKPAGTMAQPPKPDYHLFFHAPLVVFISMPQQPQSRFAQVDAGIAVENLAIAAQGMGLGSVIVGRPMEVFMGPNGAEWEKKFNFPEGNKFAIGIAIGRPLVTKEAHPIGDNKYTIIG